MKILVFCLFLLLPHSLLAVNLTDSNTLFDWAEKQYPQLFFPAGQISQEQYGWHFRYYPGSKNYVGVRVDGDVYVMGDTFGGLVRIDTLQVILEHIAGSQRVNTPAPGEDDWELIVDRSLINSLLLSDDAKTLWVGSYGGLEQRDSASGQSVQFSFAGSSILLLEKDGSGGFWAVIDDQLAHRNANGAWSTDITADSGLPGAINTIESDDSGGLWIGTQAGLAYRNIRGEWTTYTSDNSPLQSTPEPLALFGGVRITALARDNHGGLWVGTEYGLLYRNKKGEWTSYTSENSGLPNNSISTIKSDDMNGLWIVTDKKLTYRNMSGEWTTYTSENSGLPDSSINTIKSDDMGGLWIGTDKGLTYRNINGEWITYTSDNSGLPDYSIRTINSDGSGGLWLVSGNEFGVGRLIHRNVSGEWAEYLPDNFWLGSAGGLVSDGNNGLWFGTRGYGLIHRDASGKVTNLTTDNSELPDNSIRAIKSDDNNGLWIIYPEELAHYSSSGKWTTYTRDNSELPEDFNWLQVTTDGLGGVWFGSIERFTHLDANGNWTTYSVDNSDLVRFKSDGDGLWVWLRSGIGPFHSTLFSIPEDFTDSLAYFSVNGEWTSYPTVYKTNDSGLPRERILAIENDGSDGLWVSTERIQSNAEADVKSYSLTHLNVSGAMTEYTSDNSGVPSRFYTLKSDDKGGLWLGGDSLTYRSASDEWTTFTRDNSLLPNGYGIFETDAAGGLWMMNSSGLVHLTFSQ